MQPVEVHCKSEYTYAQEPVDFIRDGKKVIVKAIYKQWRSQLGPVFEVVVFNGEFFRLIYLEEEDCWQGQQVVS